MGTPPVSDEQLKLTAAVYREENGNQAATARRLGLSRSAVQDRIAKVREKFPDLVELPEKVERAEPRIEEDVEKQRSARELNTLRAKLRDATRLIADLQDRIKDLEWAAKASYEPAEWATPARTPGRSEHTPYLLTSDFQAGEVVRAEETEAGYGYDSSIFSRRYRHMIDTAIYLALEHTGREWTFPGFVYARGGDAISGGIHQELAETDDMTPLEAVQLVAEEEMGGIRKLVEAFGRVEVKSFGAAGNHDRNVLKAVSKNAVGHSYDMLIEYMLRREFANDDRVTFQTSRTFDVRFPIYNQTILLTHGDRMGSRGGQGFIGPAATILRGVQKVMHEQAALGFHIHQVHHGHFHYPLVLPFVISNGSLPGYTEYAKSFRMRPQPPQQMLCFFHPRRGVVDYKPIILSDIK